MKFFIFLFSIFQLVDRLYGIWLHRNSTSANADADDSAIARLDWYSQLQNVADLSTLKEELTLIVKDNVQTLLGVF